MSLGLLGAYNSDSETSEPEEETSNNFKNPFIVTEDSSSDEEAVRVPKDDENKSEVPSISNPFLNPGLNSTNWLPKPSFMQETEKFEGLKFESSVFSNTFRAREDKKEAILNPRHWDFGELQSYIYRPEYRNIRDPKEKLLKNEQKFYQYFEHFMK